MKRVLCSWESPFANLPGGALLVATTSESGQLSVQVEDLKIDVTAYPLRSSDDVPDSLNWEEITKFYDLEQGKAEGCQYATS
jgi:hypothetical protein